MGSEAAFPSCPGSQKGDLRGLGFDEGNLCFCFVLFFFSYCVGFPEQGQVSIVDQFFVRWALYGQKLKTNKI